MTEDGEKGTENGVEGASSPKNSAKNIPKMNSKEAYCSELRAWVRGATVCQNATALFPWYLMSTYPQLFKCPVPGGSVPPASEAAASTTRQQQTPATNNATGFTLNTAPIFGFDRNGLRLRLLSDQAQSEFIARNGGYEYVFAPFWKRITADIVDNIILLTLKFLFTFFLMNIFDVKFVFQIDKYAFGRASEEDDSLSFLLYTLDLLVFSSDLMFFEFATKFVVCIYEAIWIANRGATPGKILMGLSVLYVEAVHAIPHNPPPVQDAPLFSIPWLSLQRNNHPTRVLIYPGELPNCQRSFMRALCKSFTTIILFPMFFLMVFTKNNRTLYDIVTKTIVVETPSVPPTLRRNIPQS